MKFYLVNKQVLRNCIQQIMEDYESMDNPQVTITDKKEKRRDIQNRLYWAWLKHISTEYFLAGGEQHPDTTWHEYFKEILLGKESVPYPIDPDNEERMIRTVSTTKLTVKEFAKYLERIQHYAADELGIELYSVNEVDYRRALGK